MPSRLGYAHSKSTIAKISKTQPSRATVSVKDILTNTVTPPPYIHIYIYVCKGKDPWEGTLKKNKYL